MAEQQLFWKGNFTSDYIKRNSEFDLEKGVEGWKKMVSKIQEPGNILECGSNIGRNLLFLNKIFPKADLSLIEINKEAYDIVTKNLPVKTSFNGPIVDSNFDKKSFDLVFTCGVLIHISPDDLLENCKKIVSYSRKYVIIAEYFNRTPVMLEYHGEKNKLFKRDFGKFMLDNFDLKVIDYGFLWGHEYDAAGFDDITYWVFEVNS